MNICRIKMPSGPRPRGLLVLVAIASCLLLVRPPSACSCTSFLIKAKDGGSVYGRTMEFGIDLQSEIIFLPRGYRFPEPGEPRQAGLQWESKYAIIGANAQGMKLVVDGINEKGLAGGLLWFPGFAQYAEPTAEDRAQQLAPWQFLTWALSSFATVEEVKASLDDVKVVSLLYKQLNQILPLHYTLHDASGASIVVEPRGGKLHVHDNPIGVLTNAPNFDWHLQNLRNYVNLSPVNAGTTEAFGEKISSLGEGSGLLGLPGDPTPPSRFIRAAMFAATAKRCETSQESVRLADHIINNFDLPRGYIRADKKGEAVADYTQWSVIADTKNLAYYIKTYQYPVLRRVAFDDFDPQSSKVILLPIGQTITYPPLLEKSKPVAETESDSILPIFEVGRIEPERSAFLPRGWARPQVLESSEDAKKFFDAQAAAKLVAQVDFEKQLVLLFAWRGSGQDQLEYTVAESYPEQVTFRYVPGRTRDLRPHVSIYALRKNVTWKTERNR